MDGLAGPVVELVAQRRAGTWRGLRHSGRGHEPRHHHGQREHAAALAFCTLFSLAPLVIIAAGPQTRGVGAMAGVDLPIDPYRRMSFITEPFDATTHNRSFPSSGRSSMSAIRVMPCGDRPEASTT